MDRLLYSTLLKLRPHGAVMPSAHAYRGLALVLDMLRRVSPSAAEGLHADAEAKPLTVSPLLRLDMEDRTRAVRLTVLDEALFGLLLEAVMAWDQERPLMLEGQQFDLLGLETTPGRDTRVACASFGQLLEEAGEDEARWRLRFLTPTSFRSRGDAGPFPAVGLVFGSLARRWDSFAPVKVPQGLMERLPALLVVAQYSLRLGRVGFGEFFQPGFTGWCEYTAREAAGPQERRWLGALARFAFFSGVGAKTTMGMGQCRRMDGASPLPDRTGGDPQEGSRDLRDN